MCLRSTAAPLASLLAIACCRLPAARGQTCTHRWDPQFANPGINSIVRALQVYDGGGTSYLYAGGSFTNARGTAVNRIARWNGTTWSTVGTGVGGSGTPEIFALETWQNRLYAGGTFTSAGGAAASRLACWNGATWAATGGGATSTVFSLAGTEAASPVGPALYAGGNFNIAGTTSVNAVTRWNGVTFSALGTGMLASDGTLGTVNALLVDSGLVYAGGTFVSAGGTPANYIARWNGSTWSILGSGMGGVTAPNVNALTLYNGNVIAGGNFESAGGTSLRYIASWNGTTWSPLGSGTYGGPATFRQVLALTTWNDGLGEGTVLFAGGQFVTAGGIVANQIARWNGTTWSDLRGGMNAAVRALESYNSALFAGGLFTTAGGRTSERIAKWWCIPLLPEACCFITDGSCQDRNFLECSAAGGQSQGLGTTCAAFACPQPPQACCLSTGQCVDRTAEQCAGQGGIGQGLGTLCSSTACPQPQACCFANGTCANLLIALCSQQGGSSQGLGTNCTTAVCTGACCMTDNRCQDIGQTQCGAAGGSFLGQGTRCITSECPQACCMANGSCQNLRLAPCLSGNGTPQGRDTSCLTYDCNCPGIVRGDFTADNSVRGDDVPGFTAAVLAQPAAGSPDFCRANLSRGDVPERLDAADVTAFVNCLLSGAPCP